MQFKLSVLSFLGLLGSGVATALGGGGIQACRHY